MVSSPQRSIEKPCRPSAYTVYHGGINMSTFCDVGGGFFFARLFPGVWASGMGLKGAKHPLRRRRNSLSTPAALWMFCALSLPHDSHQKMQPLGQGSETTVSPKPSREAPGSEEGERSESLFRFRENPREYPGLLSMTSSCRDEVCLLSSKMLPIFFVSPYKPLSYWEYIVYRSYWE